MRVRFEQVGALRCRWYEAGAGDATPLVLVHGAGAAADTWVRNLGALGADRRVFAPDLVGHGFCDAAPRGALSPQAQQVAHILALADHWGLDRFAIAGSSFGGLIATLVRFARPAQVARLVIIGSASGFHPPEDQAAVLAGVLANQSSALADPTHAAIARRNAGSNHDKTDIFAEIIPAQMTAMALPDRAAFFADTIQGLIDSADDSDDRVYHRLHRLDLPTLVITGREDPRADWRQVTVAAAAMPHAELHVLDACGHKPFSEQPLTFNALVSAFLAQC